MYHCLNSADFDQLPKFSPGSVIFPILFDQIEKCVTNRQPEARPVIKSVMIGRQLHVMYINQDLSCVMRKPTF